MDITLHNTLSGKDEIFEPINKGEVLMYNCGPTVYNYAHLGNLRAYVFADTLRRMFEWNGYKVKQVINITDVGHLTSDSDIGDDKVEKAAKKEGKNAKDITEFYINAFFEDIDNLNISRNEISFPKATDYIQEQIGMIETLEEKGFTYKTSDGVYFDTNMFPEYNDLFGINRNLLKDEFARVTPVPEKHNHLDFALWKFSKNKKREQEWGSPWGVGFPGWHIECSAMSKKLLGEHFDVHTGGVDHIPVHHTNEIAQSVCANGEPFVNYWMHSAFLNIGSEKMAKSEGNFLRLDTLKEENISPLAYRYLLLTAKYSSPMEFSWDALSGSENALNKLKNFMQKNNESGTEEENRENILNSNKNLFTQFVNDNLDTPKALALVWEVIKDTRLSVKDRQNQINDFDQVLGLKLSEKTNIEIPKEVKDLILKRDIARKEKNWVLSDELRQKIEILGFEVMDGDSGTTVTKK